MQATVWLTPKLAAERCQLKSPITLHRAVRAGKLRVFKINGGRHIRYRAEDVDAWLSANPINDRVGCRP